MARSSAQRRPLWLIANHENGRLGVLTLDPGSERETMPVFSFEEEAEAFLQLGAPGTEWRARKTTGGELISLLYGPCAGAKKATLDPLPGVNAEMVFDLVGRGRYKFLRTFADDSAVLRERPLAEASASPEPSRRGGEAREPMEHWGIAQHELAAGRTEARNEEVKPVSDYATHGYDLSEGSLHSQNGHHRTFETSKEAGEELSSDHEPGDRR